jgi:hypothetical protein
MEIEKTRLTGHPVPVGGDANREQTRVTEVSRLIGRSPVLKFFFAPPPPSYSRSGRTAPLQKRIKSSLLLLLFFSIQTQAQKIWEQRTGCIVSQGNIAPGYMFSSKQATAYVDGDMEIFLENHFAVTGAVWFYVPLAQKSLTGLKVNEAVLWGAEYHFLKPSRWDPFIGLTPGAGLVRVAYNNGEEIKETPYTAVPLAALSVGCNYYVGSVFHFFAKVEGVAGQISSTLPTPMRLDELKFMAGLGWNLRLWKPRKRV